MNRLELIFRTRSLVRDLSNSFFRESDIVDFLNEGIERVGQVIPELSTMPLLLNREAPVTHLPRHYHHLLALYSASKLCTQDERHYQAGTFMNEFETKLSTLAMEILNGDTEIFDEEGNKIQIRKNPDHVRNNYFLVKNAKVREYREDIETVEFVPTEPEEPEEPEETVGG